MEYRKLGKTGLEVSAIGFGGISVQRLVAGEVAPIVSKALELGINFFDTARGYTDSEAKLGAVLSQHRDGVFIATKSMARSKEGMASDIKKSLETMGTDYIDLYQMHNVKDQESLDQVLSPNGALIALREAKEAGVIRHIGVTGHIKDFLVNILQAGVVETVQFPFNPVETNGVQALLDLAVEREIGVIVMKPLAGGAFQQADLPLRYILERPVSVAIPGMDSVIQVENNAAVGTALRALTPEERQQLEQETASLGTNFCRRCEYCQPCKQGIDIPTIFLLDGYYRCYHLGDWAKQRYRGLSNKVDACLECGECEEKCPYNLPIRKMLKEVATRLEDWPGSPEFCPDWLTTG